MDDIDRAVGAELAVGVFGIWLVAAGKTNLVKFVFLGVEHEETQPTGLARRITMLAEAVRHAVYP